MEEAGPMRLILPVADSVCADLFSPSFLMEEAGPMMIILQVGQIVTFQADCSDSDLKSFGVDP